VETQALDGLVAKRRDSIYQPGLSTGAWQKMRVNRGQQFVIGGAPGQMDKAEQWRAKLRTK
jgi:bifunctional non-homologous end joining protein LigD